MRIHKAMISTECSLQLFVSTALLNFRQQSVEHEYNILKARIIRRKKTYLYHVMCGGCGDVVID